MASLDWRLTWCITWGMSWGIAWSAAWLGLLYMTRVGARVVERPGVGDLAQHVSDATEAAEMPDDLRACVDYIVLYIMEYCPAGAGAKL